ncbi:MAG: hypothetical protein WAV47_23800, partial [Blastocatellia bacterium]
MLLVGKNHNLSTNSASSNKRSMRVMRAGAALFIFGVLLVTAHFVEADRGYRAAPLPLEYATPAGSQAANHLLLRVDGDSLDLVNQDAGEVLSSQ